MRVRHGRDGGHRCGDHFIFCSVKRTCFFTARQPGSLLSTLNEPVYDVLIVGRTSEWEDRLEAPTFRVVLHHGQLVRQSGSGGGVEETRQGGRHQLDEDASEGQLHQKRGSLGS